MTRSIDSENPRKQKAPEQEREEKTKLLQSDCRPPAGNAAEPVTSPAEQIDRKARNLQAQAGARKDQST